MEEEFNVDDKELDTPKEVKWPMVAKVLIATLILLILVLIIIIIIVAISKSDKSDNEKQDDKKNNEEDIIDIIDILQKAGYIEPWNDLYGIKMANLSYAKNDKIINSFKKDGDNYNETMGEINNGEDYPINERNKYSLYIPYSSLRRNKTYNGIFLFIHGGAWVSGDKESLEFLCSRYTKMGYITATMGYTLLIGNYSHYNIYRILDEITACLENIKEQLEKLHINTSKLGIAIGGVSAGAHISLLYGYSIKKTPIPLKFVINIVGPISLEPEFWYKSANYNETLDNLEKKTVEDAIKNGKIVKIFPDLIFIQLMNTFLGNIYTEKDLNEMIVNAQINKESQKYQEMFKKVQNSFPIKFVDNQTPPTLCEYGGNDPLVGIGMYGFLKESFDKYGKELGLVYMRYAGHELISYNTEDGIKAMRDMHDKILEYAEKYFISEE